MQVNPDDVKAGISDAWNTSDLPNLVTGGIYHGRAQTDATMPYAVLTIEEGDREEFSGTTYLQKFKAVLSIWSNAAPANAGEFRRQLAMMMDRRTLTVPNADNVTHVKPLAGKLDLDKQQRDANDVLVAGGAWEILIEATRENR